MKYALLFILAFQSSVYADTLATYRNGLLINPSTNMPYTGNLETINNDWGENSVEFSQEYVNGVMHGADKVFYKSGKLKTVGYFENGKLEGTTKIYFENGSLMGSVDFKNHQIHGRGVRFYPNGVKQLERFFVNNKLEGVSKTWDDSGNLMKSEEYKNGMLHGTLKTYYENGNIFEEVDYQYGTPKVIIIYREDGSIADKKGFLNKKIIDSIVGWTFYNIELSI